MIRDLTVLLLCQLAGEVVVRALGLPLPGPVIGLVVLFGLLLLAGCLSPTRPAVAEVADGVGRTADRILGVLGLLFVPAGVGLVTELGLFARYGPQLAIALVVSVLAALLVTVSVFLLAKRALGGGAAEGDADG